MEIDSKDYILNHDFGYGRKNELIRLHKLLLRNLEDVKYYVDWSLSEFFCADYDGSILSFDDGAVKIEITEE